MRTLAFITEAFGGSGGIALYNRDFLEALSAHPLCEEIVVVPRIPRTPRDAGRGVPGKVTYASPIARGKLGFIASAARTLIGGRPFDLVVCGLINLLPVAYAASRYLGVPLVLLVYGIDVWGPTPRPLSNRLARRVDAFISISEITRRKFEKWSAVPAERAFILPNAIHLSPYGPGYGPGTKSKILIDRYGLQGKSVIMTLGRISPDERYKGFDEIIEILPALAAERPGIVYLIAGEGADRARLRDKARSLGLGERVIFTGYVPENEKADHLRLADVFAMPSSGEGFGFVYLEAMACGIPVVASSMDGGREALRNGMLGVLVNPADPQSLKAGIMEALGRPRGIVPEGIEYFSFDNFAKRLHAIVDSVLNGS